MKRFALALTALTLSASAIAVTPVAQAVSFDELRRENLDKDAVKIGRASCRERV